MRLLLLPSVSCLSLHVTSSIHYKNLISRIILPSVSCLSLHVTSGVHYKNLIHHIILSFVSCLSLQYFFPHYRTHSSTFGFLYALVLILISLTKFFYIELGHTKFHGNLSCVNRADTSGRKDRYDVINIRLFYDWANAHKTIHKVAEVKNESPVKKCLV